MICIAIPLLFCCFHPQPPLLLELSTLLEQRAGERQRLDSLVEATRSTGSVEFRTYRSELDALNDKNRLLVMTTLDSLQRFPNRAELSEAAMDEFCTMFEKIADVDFLLSYQPYLQAAFAQKDIKGEAYATIIDRMLCFQGKPQRYGTFLYPEAKNIPVGGVSTERAVWCIEDMEKLDSLRASVGLEPFAAFLAKNGYTYSDDDLALLAEVFPTLWNAVDPDRIAKQGWDKVLSSLYAEDQGPRKELLAALMKGDKKRFSMLAVKISQLDRVNLNYVEEYLRTRTEWPSKDELSEDARKGLFFVYQHVGELQLPFREKYYPLIQEAFDKGELDGESYAIATDRLLKHRGEPQLYGTQTANQDVSKVYKIKDFNDIDNRRKKVGLNTFKEYLEQSNSTYEP